jgi:5-deoxy-D-glucuronate isomerase
MNLRLHDAGRQDYTELVTPAAHPVEHITFGVLRVGAGETHPIDCGGDEVGLILLAGTCDAQVGAQSFAGRPGRRTSLPGGPLESTCRVARATLSGAAGGASVAVCRGV